MYYYTDLVGMGMLCISGKIKIQHYNAVCMLLARCMHAAVSMSHSHSVYSTTMLSAHCLHAACMLHAHCSIQHYNAVCTLPAYCSIYVPLSLSIQHYNAVCTLPACCLHAAVSMPHSHSVYSTTMLSACCLHAACMLQYLCPTLSILRLYAMQMEQLYHSLNCVTLTALPEFVSGQI